MTLHIASEMWYYNGEDHGYYGGIPEEPRFIELIDAPADKIQYETDGYVWSKLHADVDHISHIDISLLYHIKEEAYTKYENDLRDILRFRRLNLKEIERICTSRGVYDDGLESEPKAIVLPVLPPTLD